MSRQDAHAGNAGDQLKHALLIEAIERLPEGGGWSYAETHAGAGAYRCDGVAPLLAAAQPAAARPGSGGGYAQALSAWRAQWPAAQRDPWYPGSVLLAAGARRDWRGLRLAEADPGVVDRLATHMTLHASARAAFHEDPPAGSAPGPVTGPATGSAADCDAGPATDPTIDLYPGSFETHLDELLGDGPLLMLVDPYYYQSAVLDSEEGRLGLRHMETIVRALQDRDAVLVVFTSRMPDAPGTAPGGELHAPMLIQEPWQALCADLGCMVTGSVRCFRVVGHPHAVCVAGWGAGARVVADLPGSRAWADSWLAAPPLDLEIAEESLSNSRIP